MNKKLIELLKIFSLPIIILIFHTVFDINDLYVTIKNLDDIMHFIGGIAIGISYTLFLRFLQKENLLGRMHKLVYFVIVISLVVLTSVGWEFLEFGLDTVYPRENLGPRQPSLPDTMLDLLLALVGGVIGYLVTIKFLKYK